MLTELINQTGEGNSMLSVFESRFRVFWPGGGWESKDGSA